jgi:putative aldouronate transport system substrate-binding protein
MKKRILSLVVSVVMLMVFIAGCGNSGNTDNPTPDATPAPAPTTDEQSNDASDAGSETAAVDGQIVPTPIADTTPYTLVIGGIEDTTTNSDFANSTIGQEILRLTGITVKLEKIDVTKMTALAATGDLPDILYMNNDATGQVSKALIQSGNLLQLDDLLNSRGQNILARAKEGITQLAKQTDNKIYCLPCAVSLKDTSTPQYNGSNGFYSRYDLYQGIGSPEINGIDSYLQVLKQIQDKYPTAPDGSKAYALSAWTDWGALWPYYYIFPYMNGYTVLEGQEFVNRYTGQWTSSYLDPRSIFWQAVYFYFKANQLGIFDPDGLTQNWTQFSDKIAAGEVYTCCAGNWSVPDTTVCGENAGLFLFPGAFPSAGDMYTPEQPRGYGFNDSRCISAKCKNPERAMDFLNFMDSDYGARLAVNGVKGVDWDYDSDGNPMPIGDYLQDLLAGSTTYTAGAGMSIIQFMSSSAAEPVSDGFSANITMTAPWYAKMAQQNTAAKNFVNSNANGDSTIGYPGAVYAAWQKAGKIKTDSSKYPWPDFGAYMSQSTELAQAEAQAEQYIIGNLGKLILAKDVNEFNAEQMKVINALKAQGLEKAEEEIKTQWAAAYKELKSQVSGDTQMPDNGFDISAMNPAAPAPSAE